MTQRCSRWNNCSSGLTCWARTCASRSQAETFPINIGAALCMTLTCRRIFTCLCAATGQPDFCDDHDRYIPDQRHVESKIV